MRIAQSIRSSLFGRGSITDFGDRYPVLDKSGMSSVPGLYVTGNIAGTPDIRAALNAGSDVGRRLEQELATARGEPDADYDVVVVGAGPAGVACGAVLRRAGLRFLILERTRPLAAIRAFKPDLVLYGAVTGDRGNRSEFPYEQTTAGELLARWEPLLEEFQLPIRERTATRNVTRRRGVFEVDLTGVKKDGVKQDGAKQAGDKSAGEEKITAHRVVLAVGKLIQLEKLGAAEEKLDCRRVEHSVAKADEPVTSTDCDVIARSGIRMERSLDTRGLAFMATWVTGIVALYCWLYYGPTDALGRQRIPFTDLALPGWFLYSTAYTAIIWIFGIRAIRRWQSPLQTKKFALLIACQTLLFWGLPTFAFTAIPGFSSPASGYELGYIWPLAVKPENTQYWFNSGGWAFYLFLWNVLLSFVLIPVMTIKHGKKYCSWVCGCGGLAETLGDSWRHFSPKGKANIGRERMGLWVTGFAAVATVVVFANLAFPSSKLLGDTSSALTRLYGGLVDVWLIAIVPVALYPFLGGKLWCRYWCPSAVYMQFVSKLWSMRRARKTAAQPETPPSPGFAIFSTKERCIACNLCSRYCEVGIDVRRFAVKGTTFDNANSSCIGCGICISVCPTATLSFDAEFGQGELVRQ